MNFSKSNFFFLLAATLLILSIAIQPSEAQRPRLGPGLFYRFFKWLDEILHPIGSGLKAALQAPAPA